MDGNDQILKRREIIFRGPCDPQLDAEGAVLLLADVEGIVQVARVHALSISVTYDLKIISLEQIETALKQVGFHLDNSLTTKLKRALAYFTEENERQNLGLNKLSCSRNCAIKIFASRYRRLQHGCRDTRPDHLRRYL